MARRSNRLPERYRIQHPQELCRTCTEWVSIEDIEETGDDDFPHCSAGYDFRCVQYMQGLCDRCPHYFEH